MSSGKTTMATSPSGMSVRKSQIVETKIISTVLDANGMGAITLTAASVSTPARATRSPLA